MGNMIPQKSFDKQMHIIRDVHFDVDKYKIGELYAIKHKVDLAHTIDDKIVGELTAVGPTMLRFNIFIGWCKNSGETAPKPARLYSIEPLELSINEIIDKRIEIERLMTETEAAVYLMGYISKECAKDIIPEPINRKVVLADKYKGDLSHFIIPNSLACGEKYFYTDGTLRYVGMGEEHPSIKAAYKINTPEEAEELAKYSQMNIVNEVMQNEEDKRNYVVWLHDIFSGIYKSFPILDSEGRFDPESFKGLSTGSGRVRVKLIKGCGMDQFVIQFNIHSKYIKVTNDTIIIVGSKRSKSSICMTLMLQNFRETFDKIEFTQIQ